MLAAVAGTPAADVKLRCLLPLAFTTSPSPPAYTLYVVRTCKDWITRTAPSHSVLDAGRWIAGKWAAKNTSLAANVEM